MALRNHSILTNFLCALYDFLMVFLLESACRLEGPEGFVMKDQIISIAILIGLAFMLFLARHLVLTVGRPKKKPARITGSPDVKRNARKVGSHHEGDSVISRTGGGITHVRAGNNRRFRI